METKNYTIIKGGSDGTLIVPSEEVQNASIEEFECLWVKRELFEKQGKKTFTDYDETQEFYGDTIFYGYSDVKPEPREGEYVCVYTDDGEAIGEDPYFWDYDTTCYKWWDGSNWSNICSDDYEEAKLLETITIEKPNYNFGRAVHYHLFQNERGEFIVGYENDGYFSPIVEEKRFNCESDAIEYIESLKA